MPSSVQFGALICTVLVGCASTTVTFAPSPPPPVCDPAIAALVLWTPQWRPDQKDVTDRERAAEAGLRDFLASSGCFARSQLRRVTDFGSASVSAQLGSAAPEFNWAITIGVRELGPVVKLLSSAALVDGGTEVVLHVQVLSARADASPREFAIHWQNGGPGVVKGVATLQADMQAALVAGLQPSGVTK